MPANLLKRCTVTAETADGSHSWTVENNRRALLYIPLPEGTRRVTLADLESWGGQSAGIFSCDTI